ncbi:MAG: cyclic nucleotide-binding domain-containing protein [Spirochaetaceae bacterium]|nr:cyclic nucleotide-binding domain-containing protein [Spirochaetaceae bacterium]
MLQLSFVNFKKDSYILVEGKPCGDRFYIIRTGTVRCLRERPGAAVVNLGPGDFIGVIPCMSGHNQIETVIATSDVVAIAVRRDQYSELIQQNTPVAMKIIRTFANKMRTMNEKLTQLALRNVTVPSPAQIFQVAACYDKMGCFAPAVYAYYQYLKACPTGPNAEEAKRKFLALKASSGAVHFEPSAQDHVRDYPKGAMIFSECQSGQDMFIIQEGQVKITKVVDNNEVILAVLKKGDFFGEMALLEDKPRSASAIAFESCRLMVVNRKNFDQMVATQSQLIARLTITLSERLWAMERQLDNTSLHNPVHRMVDMLSLQLEKEKFFPSVGVKVQKQFDLTAQDIANMCGIPHDEQWSIIQDFLKISSIKQNGDGKILISDCNEIIKAAAFYRKQM